MKFSRLSVSIYKEERAVIVRLGGNMSDIKINSNPAVTSHPEQFERDAARGGSFHGANVNAVPPPAESPLAGGPQKLNASRISPPQDSPLADAKSGYRLGSTSQSVGETPTNDQLF